MRLKRNNGIWYVAMFTALFMIMFSYICAAKAEDYRVTAKSGLNVRAGSGTCYDIIAAVGYGEIVDVIDGTAEWLYIDGPGESDGWCSAKWLEQVNQTNGCTNVDGIIYHTTCPTNLRNGRDTSCKILCCVPKNEQVVVHDRSNSWYEVCYNGQHGYMAGWLLETDTSDCSCSCNKQQENKQIVSRAYIDIYVVNTDVLNVRDEPSTDGRAFDSVYRGDEVGILKFVDDKWALIEYTEPHEGIKQGYVVRRSLRAK